MSKPFISYEKQIQKLINEKGLSIGNKDVAFEALKNISYYALVGGYKHPFIDVHTRKYFGGTIFENLLDLYYFDEELRSLFLKFICRIERRMRSLISYHFTEIHGENQTEYLNADNYSKSPKYEKGIHKLIHILTFIARSNCEHEYLVYQRTKYNNVPLWVVVNAMTFGQVSKMFEYLPQNIQGKICKNFDGVMKNEMIKYLKVLTLYRNQCAHGERIFSYRTYIAIPDTVLHKKMKIESNGTMYLNGKNDLFSVVITFRYLLPQKDFIVFMKQLRKIIRQYMKCNGHMDDKKLFSYMGFPKNWDKITRYSMLEK